jgi:2-polyprenyl-3-methyl-5-hydroxy-6-metoxy-1,4-benzoquinol methylase
MAIDPNSKAEGQYWEKVISDLQNDGLDFRTREDFVAKDPKYYWEDGDLMKKIMPYPKAFLKSQIKEGMKTLDLGSGSGGNSYMMAKLGADALGVDVQEENIKYLNEELKKEPNLKIRFEVNDLNVATFPENQFDLVLSWNSFHHIKETDHLIKEIQKSLKPDGLFILLEHQHTHSMFRKVLGAFFWLLLPTREKFMEKFRLIRGRAQGKSEETLSPAEDCADHDYLDSLKKAFTLEDERAYLGFTGPFIARIRGGKGVKSFCVKMVDGLDRALIKIGLIQGEQLFLVLRNKK